MNKGAVDGKAVQMYGIGMVAFVLFLSNLVGVPVLPELSVELGATRSEIPIVMSAALVTVVVVQFFTGALADQYSRKRLVLVGALLGATSSLLIPLSTHWLQLVGLRVLGGLADAIAMPALLAITATLGKDRPGRFFGILRGGQGLSYDAAMDLSLFVGPLLSIPVYGVTGRIEFVFLILCIPPILWLFVWGLWVFGKAAKPFRTLPYSRIDE